MNEIERRTYTLNKIELRAKGDARSFDGHAAVFNQLSEQMWGFREQVAPTAFNKTIKEADVRMLLNHNPDLLLARSKAGVGTLDLSIDETGLRTQVEELPKTTYCSDMCEEMDRGDLDQMSFGFITIRDSWIYDDKGEETIRTLEEVRLMDVSPVTFPAYPQTTAEVRSSFAKFAGERGLEVPAPAKSEPTSIEIAASWSEMLEALRSNDLSDEERELVRSSLEELSSLVTASAADGDPLPADARRLRLLELTA